MPNYATTCFHVLSLYCTTKSLSCQVVTMGYMSVMGRIKFHLFHNILEPQNNTNPIGMRVAREFWGNILLFCDFWMRETKHQKERKRTRVKTKNGEIWCFLKLSLHIYIFTE